MENSVSPARPARSLLRKVARNLMPPLALNLIHRAAGQTRPGRRMGNFAGGFEQARRNAKIKGWDEQSVLDYYVGELPILRAGLEQGVPFGLKETSDLSDPVAVFYHNFAACWGWVLGRAAVG